MAVPVPHHMTLGGDERVFMLEHARQFYLVVWYRNDGTVVDDENVRVVTCASPPFAAYTITPDGRLECMLDFNGEMRLTYVNLADVETDWRSLLDHQSFQFVLSGFADTHHGHGNGHTGFFSTALVSPRLVVGTHSIVEHIHAAPQLVTETKYKWCWTR